MLSLRLRPGRARGPWRFADGAWSCGTGIVRPFAHVALESFAVEAADATLLTVREVPRARRSGGRVRAPAGLDAAAMLDRLLAWPLNIQVVAVPRDGGAVAVATGEAAAAPLFLAAESGCLLGDWDVARLYPHIPFGSLDFGRAAYQLCHLALPYSRQTIFASVRQLTERARARWDPEAGTLAIAYPEPAPEPMPRRLRPGADVVCAFEALFAALVDRARGGDETLLATELSGGLDSAVATIVCARRFGRARVRSFGLMLPGDGLPAQAARRDAVAGALGIEDRTLPALPPFGGGDLPAADPAFPWGEYYREAFLALAGAIAEAGCTRLVRGMGGDEISELAPDEEEPAAAPGPAEPPPAPPDYLTAAARAAATAAPAHLDPAPPGLAAASFYESAAASTPVYMRRGIWPLYPYGAPELVAFCRSLPKEWRIDRALQRRCLVRSGLPPEVVRPDPPETFLPLRDLMFTGPSAAHVRAMFAQPLLAELGLVDAGRLHAAFECAAADPVLPGRTRLLEAASLESTLLAWRLAAARPA